MLEQQPQGFSPAWQTVEKLPLQRSDLGLASFIQAIVFGAMVVLSFTVAVVAVAGSPTAMEGKSVLAMVMGLIMLTGMGVGMSGFGLGIAALFQPGRQRTWAILGAVLNGLGLFLLGSLLALGCLMQN